MKRVPIDGRTRQARSSTQPVNLPGAKPLMKCLPTLPMNFLLDVQGEGLKCNNSRVSKVQ